MERPVVPSKDCPTSLGKGQTLDDKGQPLECAVCLQTCVHPVQLQCRHIFCFLCVKGVAIQSKRCPMCRREIPADYLDHPDLVQGPLEVALAAAEESPDDQVHDDDEEEKDQAEGEAGLHSRLEESRWFYEGRNGWWEYDVRTGQDLEQSFKQGEASCEMLIAGFLYIIDFQNMFQYRRNEPNRRRRIKRDLLSNIQNWKGVAGLRPANSTSNENVSSSTSNDGVANVDDISNGDNSSAAIAQLSSDLLSLNLVGADRDDLPTARVRAVNDSAGQSSSEASDIANPRTSRSEE